MATAAHLRPTEQAPRKAADHARRVSRPQRIAQYRSIVQTEEVDDDEQTTSAANGGGIAAELNDWARGCHSTEVAVELLINSRGGRFADPDQPWLRTNDRGTTWLDAQLIARHSHVVSSGERHILVLVEALALGTPLEDVGGFMASLDTYDLDLVLDVLRHAYWGSRSTPNSLEDLAGEWL